MSVGTTVDLACQVGRVSLIALRSNILTLFLLTVLASLIA